MLAELPEKAREEVEASLTDNSEEPKVRKIKQTSGEPIQDLSILPEALAVVCDGKDVFMAEEVNDDKGKAYYLCYIIVIIFVILYTVVPAMYGP